MVKDVKDGKSCTKMIFNQKSMCLNIKEVLIKEIPTLSWQIVAANLFEFKGNSYLVTVDSCSGFIDFKKLKQL